jgi:hypothetical protein
VVGSNGIPIEVWRSLGDVAIVWLTKFSNLIFRSNKMPDKRRRSNLSNTKFLCQNQVLILCMTQNQLFHTYD